MSEDKSDRSLTLSNWLLAHAVCLFFVWLIGFGLFAFVADRLDNDFAAEARKNHLGLIVWTHVRLLPAYALIAIVHGLLTLPWARRWAMSRSRRGRSIGTLRRIGAAFVANIAAFVVGLGPLAFFAPGSLDVLARVSAKFWAVDLYKFKTWHIQEVFCALIAWSLVLLLLDGSKVIDRRLAEKRPNRRVALKIGIGLCLGMPVGFFFLPKSEPVRHDVPHPNILIVACDSLRWDHISAHGYSRKTSPNIDRVIADGVDFDNLHVATASTLESWGSFLTGKFPANHGLRYMFIGKEDADRISNDKDTLPRILERAGYRTGVVGDWAANCFSLVDFGFEKNRVSDVQNLDVFLTEVAFRTHILVPYYFGNSVGESFIPGMRQVTGFLDAEGLTTEFLSQLDTASSEKKPYFGVLFLSSTHLPYQPPYPYNTKFANKDYDGPNRYAIDFKIDEFIKHGFAESQPPEVRQHIIDLYDGGVSHFDDVVGRIAAHLDRTGLDRNTILIVTSDHGDDLYDPGTTLGHGTNFFGGDQTTRVPFTVRLPGKKLAGTKVPEIARNIDLLPTVVELAGRGTIEGKIDGVSLVPYMARSGEDLGLVAFAETCYMFYPKKIPGETATVLAPMDKTLYIDKDFRNLFVLKPEWRQPILDTKDRMMRTPRWKLIYIKGEHGPIWRLFDMSADPKQANDLSKSRPDVLARLTPVLEEWMRTGKDQKWLAEWDDIK